jgi:elongation factor G
MTKTAAENVRNVCLAGHSGSGKTSLCDLMLFKGKAVERLGSVDQRNSVSDYTSDEQEKMSSIYATALHCTWGEQALFFTDTPGYGEFLGEMTGALHAADLCLLVLDGAHGVEVGASRAWKLARDRQQPRMIFVNRLDRERADFAQVLGQVQDSYGKTVCIPLTLPIGKEGGLSGVASVLRPQDVPADLAEQAKGYREMLMDTIAESSEELMMRYLEGEELSEAEISVGLRQAVANGKLVPVFAGSVAKDIGVAELMNGIAALGPDPLAAKFADKDGNPVTPKADGPGLGLVFKSVVDPFIGQLTFLRVVSGNFRADGDAVNLSNGHKERLAGLFLVNGKQQTPVDEAGPGMVVGIPKLKSTALNHSLATAAGGGPLAPIKFPEPVMSFAVAAVKSGEEEKIAAGLIRQAESDPTLRVVRNAETRELILSGMGDQHLNHALRKLRDVNKIEVACTSPKIPYRETITAAGEGHYRHKKQTGGHGQFAEVYLRIQPHPEDRFEFANEVVGGNVPKNFIPAVEKGVVEALERGPLAGCVVQNIRVAVYDGKHHPVDSSEMAFKIASRAAFRDAMGKARPILLEPIMKVHIMIPDEYMGDITGDLNHRRGRILGMQAEESMQVVVAEIPLAETARYATELRSMTQGRGSFEMAFDRYEMVPSNVAQQIIAQHQQEVDEEA